MRRDNGSFVARIDVAMPSGRLGLEAHSRQFHFGPDAEPLDEQRDLAAAACGWELAYLGWHATKRPKEVVGIIGQIVAARRREIDSRVQLDVRFQQGLVAGAPLGLAHDIHA